MVESRSIETLRAFCAHFPNEIFLNIFRTRLKLLKSMDFMAVVKFHCLQVEGML